MLNKVLKLIRWQNLAFIILIQVLMRYFIIKPLLDVYNLDILFSNFNFILLVLSTVLIAAGGYIINDYFDVDVDNQNNKKNYIGDIISKEKAMNIYIIINVVALAIAFYISFNINFYKLGIIFILIAGLLWFYSSSYKQTFLVGNVIIALLAALVPLIVLPYEILLQYRINRDLLINFGTNLNSINFWIIGFSAFAFLMTLIREIIKDSEDIDGDISANYNTIPIVLGAGITKIILSTLYLAVLGAIAFIFFKFINDNFSLYYILIFITLPILFSIYKIIKAESKEDYHFLSVFTKIIMVTGVLYTIVASLNF